MDGLELGVLKQAAKLVLSQWTPEEIPHKMELHQVWVHVTGVPYPLRHFLGLWAVGTLIGTTLDVDLLALRRRGIVRILVGLVSANCFRKRDDLGPFIKADGALRLKCFDFTFRPEPADFVPDVDFVPFVWSSSDSDDPSDKGKGGEPGFGQDPGNARPAREGDGDTEMTIAPGSGAVGGNSLAAEVQSLLIGRAVTPINPRPRRSPSPSTPASGGALPRRSTGLRSRRPPLLHRALGEVGAPCCRPVWSRRPPLLLRALGEVRALWSRRPRASSRPRLPPEEGGAVS